MQGNSFLFCFRYEKPIETPRDMSVRNSKWGAMDECFVFFLRESMDPIMRSLVENFVLGTEQYFTERTTTGELGFAVEKLQNGKLNLYHTYTGSQTCVILNCIGMKVIRIAQSQFVSLSNNI
jgi:hypothetical protein